MSAQAYFKNIREHIAEELQKSKVSIWLAIAWFTDPVLFNIICEKAKSGIHVRLIVLDDDINNSNKSLDFESLELNGGEIVWVRNEQNGLMHNKFCTIDSLCCINGSYNWTMQAASSNQENITIHQDQKLTKDFEDEFNRLYNQFNQAIDIASINKRLNVLKSTLLDGDKEDIEYQHWKLKELLKNNIGNSSNAKKELLIISNKIGKVDHSVLIQEIDRFIITDWTSIENNSSDELIPYRKGDKWGFCDKNKKIIIPCKYEFVRIFHNSFAPVKHDKWGLIDKVGKEIFACIYDDIQSYDDGFSVYLEKKQGYINCVGQQIIPCKYYHVHPIIEGYIVAKNDSGHFSFISKILPNADPCIYANHLDRFSEGFLKVMSFVNGKYGFVDESGTEAISCKYTDANDFHEGRAVIQQNDKYGYVDKNGNEIIPCKYENARDFIDGFASVQFNKKWGFINRQGIEVVPFIFDNVSTFHDGMAPVKTIIKKR